MPAGIRMPCSPAHDNRHGMLRQQDCKHSPGRTPPAGCLYKVFDDGQLRLAAGRCRNDIRRPPATSARRTLFCEAIIRQRGYLQNMPNQNTIPQDFRMHIYIYLFFVLLRSRFGCFVRRPAKRTQLRFSDSDRSSQQKQFYDPHDGHAPIAVKKDSTCEAKSVEKFFSTSCTC